MSSKIMFILKKYWRILLFAIPVASLGLAGAGYLGALAVQPAKAKSELVTPSPLPSLPVLAAILPWTPKAKKDVRSTHQKALIHFTGKACLDCKFQWSMVNERKLLKASKKLNVQVYESNIEPGADNSFIMKELAEYGLGGVPAYVFIDSLGKPHVLKDRLWSEKDLINPMVTLK